MKCDDYRAAYLASTVAPAHAAHRAGCPECRAAEAGLDEIRATLRSGELWEEPGAPLEEQVVATIVRSPQVGRPRRALLWAAALAVALGVGVVGTLALLRPGPPDWEIELVAVGSAPQASAHVAGWSGEDGSRMVLDVAGLGPAPADSYYEMWLSSEDGHASAGSFRDDGRLELMVGVTRREYPRLWITLEREDDDSGPSGETLLDDPAFIED